jgi:hypothetical protein
MTLECRIIIICWLAGHYSAWLKTQREWRYTRQQEREDESVEAPLYPLIVEKPLMNPWEEILARYRHKHRCASVPARAKEMLRRQHSIVYKSIAHY